MDISNGNKKSNQHKLVQRLHNLLLQLICLLHQKQKDIMPGTGEKVHMDSHVLMLVFLLQDLIVFQMLYLVI